jgi:hypothetical protein
MKKIVISALLGAMSVGVAQAAQNNVGCGLGSMVWNGKSGVAPQVMAVTTNGTSGNQTFGITSGTLGCTQDGVVQSSQKLSMFTGENMDSIARDMSVGHGESLETMAELMGISEKDKGAFFTATKENFGRIFTADATAQDVLANVNAVMADDAVLSQYAA